jgi:dolichol-phosphate mannosyltransferase
MGIVLSIVVPALDEEATLEALHARLAAVLDRLGAAGEIILVDDGSTDGSFEVMRRLRARDPRVKAIRLSRNFGHQAALMAGMDAAAGEAIVLMDADLQHPPEVIPALVAKWREGYEVVHAIRRETEGTSALKRLTSSLFYRLSSQIGEVRLEPGAADFKLVDRRVAAALGEMRERGRFLRGLVAWAGYRQAGVPFAAPARGGGASKYTWARMAWLAVDGLLSFSRLPLRLTFILGVLAGLASFLYTLAMVYVHLFTDRTVPGWTSIVALVLLLGGMQLIALGVIGEYLGRIYDETKGRPLYLVRDRLGFEETGEGERIHHGEHRDHRGGREDG